MSVTLNMSEGEARHLAWLLRTGHTHTRYIADIVQRIESQLPKDPR